MPASILGYRMADPAPPTTEGPSGPLSGNQGAGSVEVIVGAEVVRLAVKWRKLRQLLRTPAGIVGLFLVAVVCLAAIVAGVVAPGDPFAAVGEALQPPSTTH